MHGRTAASLALTLACTPAASDDTTGTTGEPGTTAVDTPTSGGSGGSTTGDSTTGDVPEDGLRIHQLQAMGTHNSYHVSPGSAVKDLDYTHAPLPDELDNGVRQVELDIHFKGVEQPIEVHHLDGFDTGSTCPLLPDCLQAMRDWSDEHPDHHVIYVMLEFKSPFNQILDDDLLATLEQQILASWPRERIVAPDDVQRGAATLKAGVETTGWPTIDASRGKILVVLHDGGLWRDHYVAGGTAGRLLFPDAFGDLSLDYAAVHTLNDPTGDAAKITAALDAGHLVRTRADSDNVEPLAGDFTRAEAALASGATFISTDYPPPKGALDYVFAIPGGTPSRCNPRTAPEDCTPQQIEAP